MLQRPTPERRVPLRVLGIALAVLGLVATVAACTSDDDPGSQATSTTADAAPGTVTTTTPEGATTLLTSSDGFLIALDPESPEEPQVISVTTRVDPADASDVAEEVKVHDQACFFSDGSGRFLMPVDPGVAGLTAPSWGVFQLTGDRVGSFKVELVGNLGAASYQSDDSGSAPQPYGCATLSDGRVVTTDLGTAGRANGQLTMWFGALGETSAPTACKLDVALETPRGVWVDDQDRAYVASPSGTSVGVWRYSRLPTSADGAGGCSSTDPVGAPLADQVRRQSFIAAGANGLTAPSGIAVSPVGEILISSPVNGVINGYDLNGDFIEVVLTPEPDESLSSSTTFYGGTPLGMAVDGDGALYYADPSWTLDASGAPESLPGMGLIQTLTLPMDGGLSGPEALFGSLTAPTSVTLFERNGGGGGSKL